MAAAIAARFADLGLPSLWREPALKQLLIGVRKQRTARVPPRELDFMEPQVLRRFATVGRGNGMDDMMFIALLTAFRFLLRISELLRLRRQDVSVRSDSIVLRLPRSKTDRVGDSFTHLARHLDVLADARLCVHCHLRRWLAVVGGQPDAPLFPKSGGGPFSRGGFLSLLNESLHRLHVIPAKRLLRAHAIRRGAASALLASGWQESAVMKLGRWRSTSAFRHYVQGLDVPLQDFAAVLV